MRTNDGGWPMAATRSTLRSSGVRGSGGRGLGADDVQAIRDAVAAGRRPKVVFTEAAGQIAGQVGQVVALGDPAESDEWVVVRFGRDELPFSPGDLRVAPRGAAARKAAAPPPAPPEPVVPAGPAFVLDQPEPPARAAPDRKSTRLNSSHANI